MFFVVASVPLLDRRKEGRNGGREGGCVSERERGEMEERRGMERERESSICALTNNYISINYTKSQNSSALCIL